ncbi:hypothetical protein A2U01_0064005, partial [Trifolium medium]|nr:hypothetical protein [Trifolium medium]
MKQLKKVKTIVENDKSGVGCGERKKGWERMDESGVGCLKKEEKKKVVLGEAGVQDV